MIHRIFSGLLVLVVAGALHAEPPRNLDDDYLTENRSNTLHGKSAAKQPAAQAQDKLTQNTPQLGKIDAIDALDSEKLGKLVGQIVTVQGTIAETFLSEKSDTRFFSFDKKREKLAFVIFKSAMKNFEKVGEPLEFYRHKKVQVTGVLTLYKEKPSMVVTKPEQIVLVR